MQNKQNAFYNPSIFDHASIDSAREIVLTTESGVSTDVRWGTETPWMLSLFEKYFKPGRLIIDYGCGVGRLSGPLVDRGFPVIGIDTSNMMRQHATNLISNDRFTAITPMVLDQLIGAGLKADGVMAVWVLQHCLDLEIEVKRIHQALHVGGVLAVADMQHRAIPTDQGWVNDGKSVDHTLKRFFTLIQKYPYDAPNPPKGLVDNAYISIFKKTA